MRFGESGWKERYYQVKLHMGRSDREMSRYVVGCYVQGLCWVLMYYYQGVQDWGWFYPFHYAPCASDLVDLHDFAGGSFTYTGAPSVSLPLFDGGRLRGNLESARAQQQGAVATYERTVQTAFREVADALAQRGTIDEQIAAQTARANAASVAFRISDLLRSLSGS